MDETEVRAALAVLERAVLGSGLTPSVSGVSIGTVYSRFRASRPRDRAWTLVRGLLRPFIVAFWREPWDAITVGRWEEHRALRTSSVTRLGRRPCDATLNLELARAKQMFKWAARAGLIPRNPLEAAARVATISARETWLTAGQVDRLLEAAEGDAFLTSWILIAVGTGMRMNEILALRWDRIAANGVLILGTRATKTRSRHVVALPAEALASLEAIPRDQACPFVFTNPSRGAKFHPCTIRRWFRFAASSAGLDAVVADGDGKLLCHDMRHTFASIADARGASATAIRDAMNHRNLRSTERYLHRARTEGALAMAVLMERRPPQRAIGTGREISSDDRKISVDGRVSLRSS